MYRFFLGLFFSIVSFASADPIRPTDPTIAAAEQAMPAIESVHNGQDVTSIVEACYENVAGEFLLSQEQEEQITNLYKGSEHTYGEILPRSVQALWTSIYEILGENRATNQTLKIADLGSGRGRFILYSAFVTKSPKLVGIEFAEPRHKTAVKALAKLKEAHKDVADRIQFIQGDFIKENLDDINVVYMAATCFGPDLMERLAEKFNSMKSLKVIATLAQLPQTADAQWELVKSDKLPMTWQKDNPVYIYKRRETPVKA